jgi:hypothetical protein
LWPAATEHIIRILDVNRLKINYEDYTKKKIMKMQVFWNVNCIAE